VSGLNWYVLSVISMLLMGTQRFLYKVSAEKGCPTAWTTLSMMATVTAMSGLLFLLKGGPVIDAGFLWLIALINSTSFALAAMSHMEALKRVPAGVAYPIIRLNSAVVILFSIIILGERVTGWQVLGMVVASAVVVTLTIEVSTKTTSQGQSKRGMAFVFFSMLCGAIATVSSKFAAIHTTKLGFMALSYFIGTLFAVGLAKKPISEKGREEVKWALIIGLTMGVINFFGFYVFLTALSLGPLSLVVTITGMHFVVAVLLSSWIYAEKITLPRALGVFLTIVSVILLRPQ
jgi:drug/metabolite transporter (DMT)-like permease